jgi:hypothetical protein
MLLRLLEHLTSTLVPCRYNLLHSPPSALHMHYPASYPPPAPAQTRIILICTYIRNYPRAGPFLGLGGWLILLSTTNFPKLFPILIQSCEPIPSSHQIVEAVIYA